jgi:dienelactone hydrolase
MSSLRAFVVRLSVFVAAAIFILSAAHADLIVLKDGFVLRGKVQREGKTILERTEDGPQLEWIPGGFYYVDDGVRRIIFNPQLVSHVEKRNIETANDVKWKQEIRYLQTKLTPPILAYKDVPPWDKKWNRMVTYASMRKEGDQTVPIDVKIPQHLQLITPEYAMADSTRIHYAWRAHYLTRELGPDVVRELFSNHKEMCDDTSLDDDKRIARRFKIYHFFTQAEWLPEAEQLLDAIAKDFPKAKDQVEEARKNLQSLKAMQFYDDIKRMHDAGQYQTVKVRFTQLPESGLPEKMLAELRALKDEYEQADANLKLARRYLAELPAVLSSSDADLKRLLIDAAKTIVDDLHLEHFLKSKAEVRGGDKDGQRVGRLDTFLAQMQQYERLKRGGNKLDIGPDQLVSLAVTGWLLGGRSAEKNPEFARQLWLARKLVMTYERTTGVEARRKLIEKYLQEQSQRNPAISVEEFAQLTPNIPPPEAPAKSSNAPTELTAIADRGRRDVEYCLQLPPEYHISRAWPVLIVLHGAAETPKQALARWNEQGARNGYIVAAPQWSNGGGYNYTADEHNVVLDLLRDLRRKFQVDSDRVFLTGWGSGASMAFDMGMSHPDQFAGVLPICGMQGNWGDRYAVNAQYLPYYAVCGDTCADVHKENRRLFKDWIGKAFPMIYVEYKGRGLEPYLAESTFAFDWMNRKLRANPADEAGSAGREFHTLRETDNRFYWLSTDSIMPRNLMPAKWNPNAISATMSAQITSGNRMHVKAYGLKQVSVWFGRGLKVNINAPVTIQVNSALKWNKKVAPDLEVLLKDLFERGDRQRLYIARVDLDL